MNKEVAIKENVKCAILAFLTSTSLCINNDIYIPAEEQVQRLAGWWDTFFWKVNASFQQTSYLLCLVSILLFFAFKYLNRRMEKKNPKWYILMGSFFSLMVLLSLSYHQYYSWQEVFGSLSAFLFAFFKGIGITVLFVYLLDLLYAFSVIKKEDFLSTKKKEIFKYTLLFLILWIPYLMILFPGCAGTDTVDQIAQILGNRDYCWTARTINLVNEEILLNNHHPIFHTFIISVFIKAGKLIGSYAWGLELYCVFQCAILAFTLACQTCYIKNRCKGKGLHIFSILFFGLNPIFPLWGMTIMKDVFYAVLLWWVMILLYGMIQEKMRGSLSIRNLIVFGVVILLWFLARNNGFYIFMLIIPFLIVYLRENKQKLLPLISMILIVMVLFQVGVQGYLFSTMNISQGSPREMFSIPFMQTARYIKEHKEEITFDEEKLLLTVFDTPNGSLDDIIEKYNAAPDKSDYVKGMYNKEIDKTELKQYFRFWISCFLKHPYTYIEAFLCLNYSWFSFDSHFDNRYYNGICDPNVSRLLDGAENPECFRTARNILSCIVSVLAKIPFTSWLVEFSFYTWAYLISFIFMVIRKKKTEMLAMSPVFINYLICFIGPVAYMRYAIPALVCFPTLIMFTFGRKEKLYNEENCSVDSLL